MLFVKIKFCLSLIIVICPLCYSTCENYYIFLAYSGGSEFSGFDIVTVDSTSLTLIDNTNKTIKDIDKNCILDINCAGKEVIKEALPKLPKNKFGTHSEIISETFPINKRVTKQEYRDDVPRTTEYDILNSSTVKYTPLLIDDETTTISYADLEIWLENNSDSEFSKNSNIDLNEGLSTKEPNNTSPNNNVTNKISEENTLTNNTAKNSSHINKVSMQSSNQENTEDSKAFAGKIVAAAIFACVSVGAIILLKKLIIKYLQSGSYHIDSP